MSIKIEKIGNQIVFTDTITSSDTRHLSEFLHWDIGDNDTIFSFTNRITNHPFAHDVSVMLNKDSETWTIAEWKTWLGDKTGVSGPQDVMLLDLTEPATIAFMTLLEEETTLTTAVAIDDYQMTVDDATGFTIGKCVSIFSVDDNRFYLGFILSASGNPVTLDTPIDFAYPSGSFVTAGDSNMNVDGSTTPVIFGLRNTDEVIGTTFHVTRLIFTCLAATAVDLSTFGDLAALTNGVVFRRTDGEFRNIFNVKTNGDIANIMFDFNAQTASNPAQGQDGFIGRLTFSGQNKMGVALKLAPGEDIQILIQDNLTGLTSFSIIAEGHQIAD